ncbi:MAG: hypothetical protein A3F72_06825 [Bacteroidetes bacterium RIFCSPLOWO2_12_FULL_35_15]|nr:MAG: hypothetical protein A3F72_06825 [Bacteroidetes bacterium RIFCSPLOWO2_12_FULL_35_15]
MTNKLNTSEGADKSKTSEFKLIKSQTGIQGLDEITYGGIPENRTTLLVGTIGSGKTVIAMEYIVNGIIMFKEPGVFMTFEEKTNELLINLATLNYDLSTLIAENKLYLEHLHIDQNEIQGTVRFNIEGLFLRLRQAIDKVNAKRVVLDSLDTLFSGLDPNILRSEFKRLFSWLKEKKVTAIITSEIGETYLTRIGLEDTLADCVIELNNRVTDQIATRRLRVVKYRGSYHGNNEYPFVIDQKGVTVFPLKNEKLQQKVSYERISSGINQLDEMLEKKGFYVGSSILVSGLAGTGKTSIASSFASTVCKNNGLCLYCTFEEVPNQIIRNMSSIGLLLDPFVKSGNLQFYYSRPTLQNLELHFIAIKKIIKETKPAVVILDPITNLVPHDAGNDVRSMFSRFVDHLKKEQITIMFVAAITKGSIELNPSDEGISSMVDTCVMVEEKWSEGNHQRSLYIMKSRGINNSKEEVEFFITPEGIKLAPHQQMVINQNGSLNGYSKSGMENENISAKKKSNGLVRIKQS